MQFSGLNNKIFRKWMEPPISLRNFDNSYVGFNESAISVLPIHMFVARIDWHMESGIN